MKFKIASEMDWFLYLILLTSRAPILKIQYEKTQTQCEEGARDVNIFRITTVRSFLSG